MKLTLLFDHRFYRSLEGVIYSPQNYSYSLFAGRYLKVFHEIEILARVVNMPKSERLYENTEGDGVRVIPMGNWHGPVDFAKKWYTVRTKVRSLAVRDTAVIMVAPGVIGGLAYQYLHRLEKPYGVEVVGDPYDVYRPGSILHPLRPYLRWWYTRELRRQCAMATVAAYVTEYALQQRYPPAPKAFSTHYSSIELADAHVVSEPRPVRYDKHTFTLIMVGTLAQLYKAPNILIDAVAICVKDGLDLRLVLVGDGKYRPELEAQAGALGIRDRVCFRGHLRAGERVRDELDQADLYVLPSYQEGLPRSMIEAMARALPCIGSSVGGIPELLPPEAQVSSGNANMLATAIRSMLSDPVRMAADSARNLERAKQYRRAALQARRESLYHALQAHTMEWLGHRRT